MNKLLNLIDGWKSYVGFSGMGLTLLVKGLGFMDDLQEVVIRFAPDANAFEVLMGFFGGLASVGVTHKLSKMKK